MAVVPGGSELRCLECVDSAGSRSEGAFRDTVHTIRADRVQLSNAVP